MSSTPPPARYPWPSSVRPSQRPPTDFAWHRYLGVPPTAGTVVKASWAVSSSPLPGWEHLPLRQATSSSLPLTGTTRPPTSFNMHEQPACHQSSIQVDADWAMSTGRRQRAFSPAQTKRFDPRRGSPLPALTSLEPAPELVAAPPSPTLSSPQQEELAQPVPREVSAAGSVQWWKQFPAASAGPSRPEPTRITMESYREARDANVGTPTGLVSSYAHHASGALPAEQSPTEYSCPYSHRSGACRPPGSAPDHATGSHGFAAGSMVPAGSPSATAHRAAHTYTPRYSEEGYTAPRYPPMAYTNTMSTSTIDYSSTHDHGDVDLTSSLRHHHRGGQIEYDTYQHDPSTVAAPMPMATTSRAPMMDTEMPSPSHHHYHPYPPSSSRMASTHPWYSHEQAASYEDQPPPYTDYSQRGSSLSRRPSLGAIHFETRRASTTADDHPFYWQGQLDRQVPYYTSIERGGRRE